jgi:hypothetical protein
MDLYAGPARLEWWANQSTCLDEYEIDMTVTVDASGAWHASGRHCIVLDPTRREGWDFLMGMDPHFSLALPGEDRGSLVVRVDEAEDGAFVLTESQGWDGSVGISFDLT